MVILTKKIIKIAFAVVVSFVGDCKIKCVK